MEGIGEVSTVIRIDKVETMKSEINLIEHIVTAIDASKIEGFKAEISSFQSMSSDLNSFLTSLLKERTTLIEANSLLVRKIELMIKSHTAGIEEEKRKDDRIYGLNQRILTLEEQLRVLEVKNGSLSESIRVMSGEKKQSELLIAEYITKITTQEIAKKQYEAQLLEITQKFETSFATSSEKSTELSQLNTKFSSVETKLADLQTTHADLVDVNRKIVIERNQLEIKYNEQLHINSLLIKENKEYSGRCL